MKKEPFDLLKTKLRHYVDSLESIGAPKVTLTDSKLLVKNTPLIIFNNDSIIFTENKFTKRDKLSKRDYTVEIKLSRENLELLSNKSHQLKTEISYLFGILRGKRDIQLTKFIIGDINKVQDTSIFLNTQTVKLYIQITKSEERKKQSNINSRLNPIFTENFGNEFADKYFEAREFNVDYKLILKEMIATNQFTQEEIREISEQVKTGNNSQIIIERKIVKQVEWLIDVIENEILNKKNLTTETSKQIGNKHFLFSKSDIKGPEHLMEKILTLYGQHTFFGVPALINTNKFIIHNGDYSQSQLDLILITNLGEIELVELKRPDETIFEFDKSRNKFYPSKSLATAISQCERYITTITKDNDDFFTIDGKKIRQFLQDQIGDNNIDIESVRPTATIIIGNSNTLFKPYQNQRITKAQYEKNGNLAYKELKNTFKNIKILTYSELVNFAKTRLQISNNDNHITV